MIEAIWVEPGKGSLRCGSAGLAAVDVVSTTPTRASCKFGSDAVGKKVGDDDHISHSHMAREGVVLAHLQERRIPTRGVLIPSEQNSTKVSNLRVLLV